MGGSPLQPGMVPPGMGQYQAQPNMWQGFEGMAVDGQSPSDSWSNASVQGPAVPATLNVEDWCVFVLLAYPFLFPVLTHRLGSNSSESMAI